MQGVGLAYAPEPSDLLRGSGKGIYILRMDEKTGVPEMVGVSSPAEGNALIRCSTPRTAVELDL